MSERVLAIDFGTAYTSAAIADGDRVEILEVDGYRRLPSLVLLTETGRLIAGQAAVGQAAVFPERVERTPKREVGKPFLLLDGGRVRVAQAIAAVLGRVAEEYRRRHNATGPDRLVLTHPARWHQERLAVLAEAASRAGLPEPTFLPEPVAAAAHYVDEQVKPGDHVAVYDLGAGTFDTAVLRRTADGFEVAGPPGGDPELGGDDFDARLTELAVEHATRLDAEAWNRVSSDTTSHGLRERTNLHAEVRKAKEALSSDNQYTLFVPRIEAPVRLTRGELNQRIEAELRRSVELLDRTMQEAGLSPQELAAVYLTGGSSRIPLVSQLVAEWAGRLPVTRDDPKGVVALGAAKAVTGTPTTPATSASPATSTPATPVTAPLPPRPEQPAPAGDAGGGTRPDAASTAPIPVKPQAAPPEPASLPPRRQLPTWVVVIITLFTLGVLTIGSLLVWVIVSPSETDTSGAPTSTRAVTASPTTTSPPAPETTVAPSEVTAGLRQLRDLVGDGLGCVEHEWESPGNEVATLSCSGHSFEELYYEKYADLEALNAAFETMADPEEIPQDGDCSEGKTNLGAWTSDGRKRGRLACFYSVSAAPNMVWTIEDQLVLAWGRAPSGKLAELYKGWEEVP